MSAASDPALFRNRRTFVHSWLSCKIRRAFPCWCLACWLKARMLAWILMADVLCTLKACSTLVFGRLCVVSCG